MQITRALLVVAVCSLAPIAALAEPPSGSYSLTIGGADSLGARLRLIDGVYDGGCDNGLPTEVCTTTVMHTDAAGVVTGTETRIFSGATTGEMRFVFEGSVKARPGLAKAKLLFVPEGTLQTSAGAEVYSGNGKALCRDDPIGGQQFDCEAKLQLCFENPIGSDCDRFFLTITVPQQRASWVLDLDLSTAGSGAISGTARASLGNGVAIDFTVAGKYSAKSDLANLSLKGLGTGSKSKVTVKKLAADSLDLVAGRIKFKVADQIGVYDITPPTP